MMFPPLLRRLLRVRKAHELLHGIRAPGPWTMLGLPSRCTCVWTIVSYVRERVKSLKLPMYAWVVGFISFEQTSSSLEALFEDG